MDYKELVDVIRIMNDNEIAQLIQDARKPRLPRTGYEQPEPGEHIYYEDEKGWLVDDISGKAENEYSKWECANYYSDYHVATDCVRADTLMRKLRRYAVTRNSLVPPCSQHGVVDHWSIGYYPSEEGGNDYEIQVIGSQEKQNVGEICFKYSADAEAAIQVFYNELKWYFTEYLPTMR